MISKKAFFDIAFKWISKRSVSSVKAQTKDYEQPKVFRNKNTGDEIQPDFSFITNGGSKSFSDIALKSDSPQKLVTRWKLLSLMASMNKGRLHLLSPRGHKMFTQKLVDKYKINALIHSI